MKHAESQRKLGELVKGVSSRARRLSWNLARTNVHAIEKAADGRLAKLKAESEAFRRMPRTEHERVRTQILREETAARSATASAARWGLEPLARELADRYTEFVAQCRHDTAIDFPEALVGLDAAGMLTFALVVEALRPTIAHAGPDELLARHQAAMLTKDAASLAVATLIEQRVARGALATSEQQLPAVKALHDWIDGVQEMRVPSEQLADVPDTLEFARKQLSLADLVYIKAVALDQSVNAATKAAFDAEADQYAEELAAAAGDD